MFELSAYKIYIGTFRRVYIGGTRNHKEQVNSPFKMDEEGG